MTFSQKRHYIHKVYILAMALIAIACSRIERSENEKLRQNNCTGEYVHRKSEEHFYVISEPLLALRPSYPWESEVPRITKEFFRCKGSPATPPVFDRSNPSRVVPRTDCEGGIAHGLPTIRGQRTVYPVLIELLNYVQKSTGKRVIITSGYRCPTHNVYVDSSRENRFSKHQMGAEVDFYVQDMERRPMEVIQILMDYYKKHPVYQHNTELSVFQRYDRPDAHVTTKPWFNREIYIKYHSASEGRNGDNQHSYPYITLQVRYDRDAKERVVFDERKLATVR